jgi:hypothetical protein
MRRPGTRLSPANVAGYAAHEFDEPARHIEEGAMIRTIEQTTMRKVYWRVLPSSQLCGSTFPAA